jgi:3-oxoacyl-[acyl-carrier-protein] synthase I
MTEPVVIVGVGMMTAVGLSAAETAGAVRAGMARFAESAIQDRSFQSFTLAEVPEDGLPELSPPVATAPGLTHRELRMLRLATTPLRECLKPLASRPPRMGLCLALPEIETTRPLDRAAFLARLAAQTEHAFDPDASDSSHVGRAGGFAAIGQAVLTIQSGRTEFIIAGGIDTYRDLYVLAALDREERVKSATTLDGFIPGEGAGFLLLASERAATARGLPSLGRVAPVAMGFEPGHLYSSEPYRGDGLAATLQALMAQGALEAPVGEVYSSMTGESHWAKEWGVAFLRSKAAFREGHGMHHPADCFGDTGAASGPLMVGLAALGIKGRYRRSPALAYGSSDRGPRAAVVISAGAG